MKKKLVTLVITLAVTSLCACGSNETPSTGDSSTEDVATADNTSAEDEKDAFWNAIESGHPEEAAAISYDTTEETDATPDNAQLEYDIISSDFVSFVNMDTPAEYIERYNDETATENLNDITIKVENASEAVTATIHAEEQNGDVVVELCEENGYSVTFTTSIDRYSLISFVNEAGEEVKCDEFYEKEFVNSGQIITDSAEMRVCGKNSDKEIVFTFTCK